MKYLKTFNNDSEYVVDQPNFSHPHVSFIKSPRQVIYEKTAPAHDYSKDYLTFEAISAGYFYCNSACSYSMDDGATWTSLAARTSTPTVNAGDKIMFKANNTPTIASGVGMFSGTCDFNAMGNPYSMFSGDSFTAVTSLPENATSRMFSGNTHLVSAEHISLPAPTVNKYSYYQMFGGCSSLVKAPSILPATTIGQGSYDRMFSGCTSLTVAPVISATSVGVSGCASMFDACSSLVTAPVISATGFSGYAFTFMFKDCTSLTTFQQTLPVTSLTEYCYASMFAGCTALTTAPELPATTLVDSCYASMFHGCTSLTTAPELPATTLVNGCYWRLFRYCESLSYVKMMATSITASDDPLYEWMNNVSATGTFVKNANATWSESGVIPSGWTVQTASS